MTLGEKIRLLRSERNISQTEFAEKIKTAKSHVWRYENDKAQPSAEVVKRIATVFNVSADYLLFDASEKENITKISDKKLLRQFEEIDKMDNVTKDHVRYLLELVINNQKIKNMTV